MKWTFFLSGVGKLIVRHMVVGSAAASEAVEAEGSWPNYSFGQFAQFRLS